MESITGVVTPLKSANDDRQYRVFTLANGLRALAISDPTTDKAAASMNVRVGNFGDPEDLPGLAHFLEHMLFLGTEKYPDENQYNSFLNSHGGNSNAFTAREDTNYFFDIMHAHFKEALDIFAQFFIAPLFTASAVDRELTAVDNENAKNLQEDGWRSQQLLHSTASPLHPFHKFGTGNFQTLRDGPREKGVDVLAALRTFHAKHYSANHMGLCVYGRESLDELQALVVEKFSAVRNNGTPPPTAVALTPAQKEGTGIPFCDTTPQWLNSVPVKDLHTLSLTFPTPPQTEFYKQAPSSYLSHLLGHEGPGSLLSLLKRKNWANGLWAGQSGSHLDFDLFTIQADLTVEGVDHAEEITTIMFQYIKLIQDEGIQEWIFKEEQAISNIKFRFLERGSPMNYAQKLSKSLWDYAPPDIISGPYLREIYDPNMIRDQLSRLVPGNVRVFLRSKKLAGTTDLIEPWYQSQYSQKPVNATLLQQWKDVARNPELVLPLPNEYIATDVELKAPPPAPSAEPRMVVDAPGLRLWHKQDTTFNRPKMMILGSILVPSALNSAENAVLSSLYYQLVDDSINEEAYSASLAGCRFSIGPPSQVGMQISLNGYNQKLPVLLAKVLQKMKHIELDNNRFLAIKERQRRAYENSAKDQPHGHATTQFRMFLMPDIYNSEEKLAVIDRINVTTLQNFIAHLFDEAYAEFYLCGNVREDEAVGIGSLLTKTLDFRPYPRAYLPPNRLVKLSEGTTYVNRMRTPNTDEVNSAVKNWYQFDLKTTESDVMVDMLQHLMREPAFNQLRTKEQLGYLVWTTGYYARNIGGIRVIVQSKTHDPDYLDGRIETFISDYETELREMTEEFFTTNVNAVIAKKLEKDKNLGEEAGRLGDEIQQHQYQFDRIQREVEQLRKLTKGDIIAFFDKYMKAGPTRKKISLQVYGAKTEMPEVDASKYVVLKDFYEFKRNMPLYPSLW